MTFSVLTCTVAVGNAAQNHSDSARNVCRKKAAQISLVEVLQLEDILWDDLMIKVGFSQKVMAKFSNLSNCHSCEPKTVPALLIPVNDNNKILAIF